MNKLHLIILSLMALVSAREFKRLKNSNLMSAQRLAPKKKADPKKDEEGTEKKDSKKKKKEDDEGQDSKLLANTFMNTHNLLASKSGLAPPEGESGSGGSQEGKDKDKDKNKEKEEGDNDESSKGKKSKKNKKKDGNESSLKTRGSSNSEALLQRKSSLLSEDVETKDYLNASAAANDEEDDSE
ncbi:hypothetical protein VCUG_00336 [Vavraia culicis subsp. floridensis]|uniref:Uncharacterized protein n=1 Tax=Vavraia culicis (isolate floridensis) TaxID=948595 RepID=L2GXR9_VAVCU|nr:uncharacterized protein VCUG_00336 [Vavraia culicis subsp. floridensis]ELA48098.1 hypothetical protein VCUG_00336 [Vavraia culicis subsp. floridensis]